MYPQLAEKIIKLEKVCGKYCHHKIFDPKTLPENIPDEVGIQNITKVMAEFIGMNEFIFIVSFTKLGSAAGQISLSVNRDKNVFIEIQRDKIKCAKQFFAILAHELAHQYLHIRYIDEPNELENERLTDVCAVYVGFGKLLLNGYLTNERETSAEGEIVTTYKGGYLTFAELAFVYREVCKMRKIAVSEYSSGLSIEAREEVLSWVRWIWENIKQWVCHFFIK
tara:strand:+ start:629 stop:1297 length:669 start_codon:yes stop_codon:yes gene_type:complete